MKKILAAVLLLMTLASPGLAHGQHHHPTIIITTITIPPDGRPCALKFRPQLESVGRPHFAPRSIAAAWAW